VVRYWKAGELAQTPAFWSIGLGARITGVLTSSDRIRLMIRWVQRTQARRILVPSLAFFVGMIFTHAILDSYYHGRIRFDFFPRRIMVYLLIAILMGFLNWRKDTPPA